MQVEAACTEANGMPNSRTTDSKVCGERVGHQSVSQARVIANRAMCSSLPGAAQSAEFNEKKLRRLLDHVVESRVTAFRLGWFQIDGVLRDLVERSHRPGVRFKCALRNNQSRELGC